MKKIFIFLLFSVSLFSFSQTVKIEGNVSELGKASLDMANVMAINQATKAIDSYAITNDKGKFVLNLKQNSNYTIKFSYLGMKTKEIQIATKTSNMVQNITMEAGGIELEGVEVVREMPVSIIGDTISYKADSFKNGTEKKLEDVLKKLPGVEVNSDGEVEVEGKKVTKLMVEGKDFFDGDTKLGVKNIPADAIDKVQVLRNYNENSILKGVENNQDNLAMNIKLKDGKKNFWFGDMTAGIGVAHEESRYLVNPKLFYYNPKYSVNLISNFNNIGELPLTIQDYFKMTGGFKNMMSKGGSSFNVSSNDLGIAMMRNNRAKDIETQFGATNFSYNVSKKWALSGFGIISSSLTDMEMKSQTNILKPNSSEIASTENRNENSHQKSNLGMFKLSSSFKPNSKFQFDYDVLSKTSKQDENNDLLRESIVSNASTKETIFTNKNQKPTSVSQNASIYYTLNDKNIFAFESQHLYQDENPFYNANLQSDPFVIGTFNPLGYDYIQVRTDLNQDRFVKTNKIDAKLDYYYVLTPKSNINITLGNTYSYQSFNSRIFQVLDNGTINNLNSASNNNDLKYNFNDVFLGLHYKMLSGKFTITPGVSFHNYNMTNTQLGTDVAQKFTKILPDFMTVYQIKKAESLTYNFGFTNSFTDVTKLIAGNLLNSYSSMSTGNRNLLNSIVQSHSLRYFKYNMFNMENISGFLNYSKTLDAIKSRYAFNGVNQTSSPINSALADQSFSGMIMYGRSFLKHYKASLSASLSWSKFNNIQFNPITNQDILTSNESFTQDYTVKTATNFKNFPNLEVGYKLTVNDYSNNKFFTDKPFAKIEYYFIKSFAFVSEYEFYHYYNNDKTTQNEYDFLSASLVYQKKESKWEYKLGATNLLNTTSLNDDSFSQISTRTSQYTVQPRYIIFSLKYNL